MLKNFLPYLFVFTNSNKEHMEALKPQQREKLQTGQLKALKPQQQFRLHALKWQQI